MKRENYGVILKNCMKEKRRITMNEIATIEKYTLPAISKARGKNYEVSIPGKDEALILHRDVDFGKFGQAKTPSLLKAGAEKILGAYGVAQEYTVEKAIEEWNGDVPFFFYRIKCTLFTYINGERYNLTDGFGKHDGKAMWQSKRYRYSQCTLKNGTEEGNG